MKQYIDKAKLLAEIKRRILEDYNTGDKEKDAVAQGVIASLKYYIEDIPSTPEILKKNGFGSVTDEMFSACETETYSNQELKIYLSHIGCEYNPVQLVVYMGYEPQERVVLRMMPCEYVHEMQHAFRLLNIDKEIKL